MTKFQTSVHRRRRDRRVGGGLGGAVGGGPRRVRHELTTALESRNKQRACSLHSPALVTAPSPL